MRLMAAEIAATSPRKAVLTVVLTVAMTFTEGMGLLLLMPMLQLVGVQQQNTLPNVTSWFAWFLGLMGVQPTLASVLLLYVVITGARTALQRWQSLLSASVREDYSVSQRERIYRAIAGAEWKFLVSKRPSDFTHVLAGEISQLGNAAFLLIDLLVTAMVSLVYVALAIHLSPVMAGLVVLSAAVLGGMVRGSIRTARRVGTRAGTVRKRFIAAIAEQVGSLKTARMYGAEDRHLRHFQSLSNDLRGLTLQANAGETDLQQILEFGSVVLTALIVFVSLDVLEEPAAPMLVLLFIFARLMPRLMNMYRRVQVLAGTFPVMHDVLAFERECLDAAAPPVPPGPAMTLSQAVRLEDVSFTYLERATAPAVRGVTLEIPAGYTTAIVGPSGAGKSTIVDLLIGLLPPTTGRILVDGQPLTPGRMAAWREQIGYVSQDTFLFHDTIRANLLWGRPGASDDDVQQALRLAAADEFIASLPEGLETLVGERGVMVSGGERQRLSLARALLRRPKVLVLDEATSSLDSETERRIRQAIEGLHREMTIVVVTHRLSFASSADCIHVLDGGALSESGTWEGLLEKPGGRFRALCGAQGIYERPVPAAQHPVGGAR